MRNTELTRSQQIIISAIISAVMNVLLVLGIAMYQSLTGAWFISNTAMMTFLLVVSLALLLKEIIQTLVASEQQQRLQHEQRTERWIAMTSRDTQPHAAVVPPSQRHTTLRDYS